MIYNHDKKMPIGVPRIIYCWGEELPAQWTDIYNFIFRRRMVFLMQYLDDELCNQICGLLINIHMEDRSKEMEKKEMERSGVFKSSTKSSNKSSSTTSTSNPPEGNDGVKGTPGSSSFYNKKSRSMEDLLNADEDLGIDEVDKLEQYTLQKITTEWLNWNAQFFDYSDEPYLYYLAELLSKDFNKSQTAQRVNEKSEISLLLNMLKKKDGNVNTFTNSTNKGSIQMGEVYSPFRTNANFSSLQEENKFKQEMLFKQNLFSGKKGAKKQKLLQMFQDYQNLSNSNVSVYHKQDKTQKNISNLLSNLAQNHFSSKLSSSSYFSESSEKMLSQRNLRRELTLENNFSDNFNSFVPTKGLLKGQPANLNSHMKSFNYLSFSAAPQPPGENAVGNKGTEQSEFRDYYRKQTERTLMDEESKKVFVIINSFGGSVGNGITVHDALQFIKAGSLTLALGVAASAASLALAGGTIGERYVTEGCHVMIHQPECLTSDHNVLTSRGWIPINNVTLQDKVAVLNNHGVMSYEHPTKVHKFDYEGPMYEVKTAETTGSLKNAPTFGTEGTEGAAALVAGTAGVDLFVTPNHRMYVNTKPSNKEEKYELIEASSIYGKKVHYKNNAIWNKTDYQFSLPVPSNFTTTSLSGSTGGREESEIAKRTGQANSAFSVPNIKPTTDVKVDMDSWLIFFGLWITEGRTSIKTKESVFIPLVKQNVKHILENALDKLGYNYVYNEKQYEIKNKELWSYLNTLENVALNKRLPDWVWELSSKQCKILLNGLILSVPSYGSLNSLLEGKHRVLSEGTFNTEVVGTSWDRTEGNENSHYFTASEALALDVSRLALHAGFVGSINHETSFGVNHTNKPLWCVNVLKSSFYPCVNSDLNKIYEAEIKSKNVNVNLNYSSNEGTEGVAAFGMVEAPSFLPSLSPYACTAGGKGREVREGLTQFKDVKIYTGNLTNSNGFTNVEKNSTNGFLNKQIQIQLENVVIPTEDNMNPSFDYKQPVPYNFDTTSLTYDSDSDGSYPALPHSLPFLPFRSSPPGGREGGSEGKVREGREGVRSVGAKQREGAKGTVDRFVYYKGPVYCLTVPNSVFYVQRNGKAVWTGNSALQGQASDIWIDSQEIMKIRLDVAEIYSLSTYRPRHKILRDLDRDFYLTATETIQYGLADEIATNEVMQNIVELTHQAWDVHDSTQERLLDTRARIVGDSAQTQESTG